MLKGKTSQIQHYIHPIEGYKLYHEKQNFRPDLTFYDIVNRSYDRRIKENE